MSAPPAVKPRLGVAAPLMLLLPLAGLALLGADPGAATRESS
jgi:hypothetical protein